MIPDLDKICALPEKIREKSPLVHMIPNSVTVALCTDGLSALGARPLMAMAPEEMDEIPAYADAVVVNMGQPTKEKLEAATIALQCAAQNGTPIVWDPVGAGASLFRKESFRKLYEMEWKGIIKGNRSEMATLQSGRISHQGIDSIGDFSIEIEVNDGRVWAVSGGTDVIFDEHRYIKLDHSGTPGMLLTGSGCLTGALMGACYAVEPDPFLAACGAFAIMTYAGSYAAQQKGYGTQKMTLLDRLTKIDIKDFENQVKRMEWK